MTDKLVRSDNATDKDRIEALTVLLSRKDNDGTRGKLFLPIFSDLESPSESLKLLLEAAIEKSADKTLTNELRATQFVIIGNLMDELIKNAPKESQFLFEIIRDKSLKADGRVAGYMELNGLKKDTQPSQRARKLLAPPEAAD
ncbi:MAG: hypothetical protein COT74_10035 [Bdellovibrionales bacterium CG10_big_fil_rev_8_21_14_0_10_45_34]|nr:MAG: hypothetical protein COT74_10035 [Bdellovibrionales bacterium CG10_big_fil_rev_8_21_14_0_10_45_34]